jgi:8-oxo-dGTP pyrophosphatase MutT (NUDIX family)
MSISLRAGLILTNSKNEYLLVKDTRSKKWSFPKGGKEDFEVYLNQTAEREMLEETGFLLGRDYTYNPNHSLCSVVQTKEYCSVYYKTLKDDLYFTQKLDEHIEEIRFVNAHDLVRMDTNYVTKNAFFKNAFKDL